MVILIDGDSIAYIAASATQDKEIQDRFKMVDDYIESILSIAWDVKNIPYELYVEDPNSKNIFRNHVAVTKPYKGSRRIMPLEKEKLDKAMEYREMVNECKEYMRLKYDAIYTKYLESEDLVAIRANEIGKDKCVIATIDKDMYQISGKFYNYKTGAFSEVSEREALRNLYKQILTGDPTDDIPGLKGVGLKKAEAVLGDAFAKHQYAERVAMEYIRHGKSYDYLLEQCRLLYLLRSRTEVFKYPIDRDIFESFEKNYRFNNQESV